MAVGGSCHDGGVFAVADDFIGISIASAFPSSPHDAAIGSLVTVGKLAAINGTWQQMRQGDDEEGDGQSGGK